MSQLLFQIALYLSAIYLLSLAYSSITGKQNSSKIDGKELSEAIKKMNGIWWIFIPLTSLGALIFNIGAGAVWFLAEVIGLLVRVAKWIWTEVIIAGGYFIFKNLWHYLVSWPWRIFMMGLDNLRGAFKRSYLWIGGMGLFISLAMVVVAKFLENTFGWGNIVSTITSVFSAIPVGVALSYIILDKKAGSEEAKTEARKKYTSRVVYLTGTFVLFILAQAVLLFLGSFTLFSQSITALFAGGNIIVSLFIILNAGLLLFAFGALPSFSLDYEGNNKSLLKDFGNHLLHKWPQYILAIPASILPAAILCAIPYFLSQGAIHLTDKATEAILEMRITDKEKAVSEKSEADYKKWLDIKAVTDEEVKKQMSEDLSMVDERAQIQSMKRTKSFMADFYSRHKSPYGAAPVVGLVYGFSKYQSAQNKLTTVGNYDSAGMTDTSSASDLKNNLDNNTIPGCKKTIDQLDVTLKDLDEKLTHACDEGASTSVETPTTPPGDVQQPTPTPPTEDYCEQRKKQIRADIEQVQTQKKQIEQTKARAELISAHLSQVIQKMNSIEGGTKTSQSLALLLASLWMCLIMAFSFGFALPAFALTNHSVYTISDGDNKYYLVSQIEEAKSKNKNQPILGLLLLPALFPVILSGSCYLDPAKAYSKQVLHTMGLESVYNKIKELKDKLSPSVQSSITIEETPKEAPPVPEQTEVNNEPSEEAVLEPVTTDTVAPSPVDSAYYSAPATETTSAPTAPSAETYAEAPVPAEENTAPEPMTGRYLATPADNQKIYIYSTPDAGADKISYIASRVYVTVSNVQNGFGQIEFSTASGSRVSGWINMNYLIKVPGSMIQ